MNEAALEERSKLMYQISYLMNSTLFLANSIDEVKVF